MYFKDWLYVCVCVLRVLNLCVSKWPAVTPRAYLWLQLAKIHLLKSAFYSVSHEQIPAELVHFQSTQLHPQFSAQHLLTCTFNQVCSCKAALSCLQWAARCVWVCNPFYFGAFHNLVYCQKHRHIQHPHIICTNLCVFLSNIYSDTDRLPQIRIQWYTHNRERAETCPAFTQQFLYVFDTPDPLLLFFYISL